jgi:hypothetical protein
VSHQGPAAGIQVAVDTFVSVTIGVAPAPPAACP